MNFSNLAIARFFPLILLVLLGGGGAVLLFFFFSLQSVRSQVILDGCAEYFITVQKVNPTTNGNGTPNANDPGPIFGYFKFFLNTTNPNGFPNNLLPSYIGILGDIYGTSASVKLIKDFSSWQQMPFPPAYSQYLTINEEESTFTWEVGEVKPLPCNSLPEIVFPQNTSSIELFTLVVSGATSEMAFLRNCKMTIENCNTGCTRELPISDETLSFPVLTNCSPQVTASFAYGEYFSAPNPVPLSAKGVGVSLNFTQPTNVAEMVVTVRLEPTMSGSGPITFQYFKADASNPNLPSFVVTDAIYNDNDNSTDVRLVFTGAWTPSVGLNLIGVFWLQGIYNQSAGGKVKRTLLNSTIVRSLANGSNFACKITPKVQTVTITGLPVSTRVDMAANVLPGNNCDQGLEFFITTLNNGNVAVTRLRITIAFKTSIDNHFTSLSPLLFNLPACTNACTLTQDPQDPERWDYTYEYIGIPINLRGVVSTVQTRIVFPIEINSGCVDYYVLEGEITTSPGAVDQAIDYQPPATGNDICATKIIGYINDVNGYDSPAKAKYANGTIVIDAVSTINTFYNKTGIWNDCGEFSFCVDPAGFPYNVTVPNTRKDEPLCGITTYDLLLISRHILGVTPLPTSAQFIAASANGSEFNDLNNPSNPNNGNLNVTTNDILQFRRLILGTIPNTIKTWTYLNSSFNAGGGSVSLNASTVFGSNHEITQSTSDVVEFTAVKHGDVNLSCNCDFEKPSTSSFLRATPRLASSKELSIPVRLDSPFKGFSALQFALNIDTSVYNISRIVPNKNLGIGFENLSVHAKQLGEIRFAWNQMDNESLIRSGDLLFDVVLTPKSSTGAFRKLPENSIVQLAAAIESVGYESNGEESYLGMAAAERTANSAYPNSTFFHVLLSPNPLSDESSLRFVVETQEESNLTVHISDINGREKAVFNRKANKGETQFSYDPSGLAPGMYLIAIVGSNGEKFTGKVIKL